jgi:hypothetical protein
LCALDSERQPLARTVELHAADLSVRQRWNHFGAIGQVDHGEAIQPVGVGHPGQVAPVAAAREGVDVPGYVRGQCFDLAGDQVHATQLLEFAVTVGEQVHTAPVGRELRLRHAGHILALADRRDGGRGDIQYKEVSLVGRDAVDDQQFAIVG